MSIELTDEKLVCFFNQEIFNIYKEAKELYLEFPVLSLIKARYINTLLVDMEICRTEALQPCLIKNVNTFKKVNALSDVEGYPSQLIELFHRIRRNSNRAAHLEKNELSHDEFCTLARDTLRQICGVVALLNYESSNSEPTKFRFVETTTPLLKGLLYRAIVENDTNSKVKAGTLLSECWVLEIENNALKKEKLKSNNALKFDKYQRKLAYEFLYSAAFEDNDLDAMYYLAFLIEHQWIFNRDSINWSEMMLKAAKLGHEKAKRFWSYRTIISRDGKFQSEAPPDEQKLALCYVREAASEHCKDQMLLSRLYTDGYLVEKDHNQAQRYLALAAENGDNIAQYQYANMCFNSGDNDKANQLLLLSALGGYKPALSEVIRNNCISYEDLVEAYEHYQIIDLRDGESDTMEHNTDIEIGYAERVVERGDTDKFAEASIRINNFLQTSRMSLSNDKFLHYLKLYEEALNGAKPTTPQEAGNISVCSMMLEQYYAEYVQRQKEFPINQTAKLTQQQTAVHKFLSDANGAKVGRNEPCPCGSGLKYKKCCR